MPKLFDENGAEVEAYTKEELEAKIKVEKDTATAAQADKDKNFSKLREEKEAADKKLADAEKLSKEKDEALANKDKEYEQKEVQKERGKKVDALAEGNKELKDKIEFHLKRFKDEIKTPEDFEKLLNDAYVLASGNQIPDKLQDVISSGGSKGGNGANNNKLPISPEAMSVASKLGLSEEDVKKYGGQK